MVAKTSYIPDAQDVVWMDFDPPVGHEQAKYRPALVLTSREYNSQTGLMICCPITTKMRKHPFEIPVPKGILREECVILVHQVKAADFRIRKAKFEAKVPRQLLQDVKDLLGAMLEIDVD